MAFPMPCCYGLRKRDYYETVYDQREVFEARPGTLQTGLKIEKRGDPPPLLMTIKVCLTLLAPVTSTRFMPSPASARLDPRGNTESSASVVRIDLVQ